MAFFRFDPWRSRLDRQVPQLVVRRWRPWWVCPECPVHFIDGSCFLNIYMNYTLLSKEWFLGYTLEKEHPKLPMISSDYFVYFNLRLWFSIDAFCHHGPKCRTVRPSPYGSQIPAQNSDFAWNCDFRVKIVIFFWHKLEIILLIVLYLLDFVPSAIF